MKDNEIAAGVIMQCCGASLQDYAQREQPRPGEARRTRSELRASLKVSAWDVLEHADTIMEHLDVPSTELQQAESNGVHEICSTVAAHCCAVNVLEELKANVMQDV